MSNINNNNNISDYRRNFRDETINMFRFMFGEETLNDMLSSGAIDSVVNSNLPEEMMEDGIVLDSQAFIANNTRPNNPTDVDDIESREMLRNTTIINRNSEIEVDRETRLEVDELTTDDRVLTFDPYVRTVSTTSVSISMLVDENTADVDIPPSETFTLI